MRFLLISSSLMVCVGFIGSMFVPSLYYMLLTYGIITGLGLSCFLMSAIYIIQIHFEDHRALAQGISFAGYSTGSLIWSPLAEWLISLYGWRGTFLIISGIQLNGIAFGLVVERAQSTMNGPKSKHKKPRTHIMSMVSCANQAFETDNAKNSTGTKQEIDDQRQENCTTYAIFYIHNKTEPSLSNKAIDEEGSPANNVETSGAENSCHRNTLEVSHLSNEKLTGIQKYKLLLSNHLFLVFVLSYFVNYLGGTQAVLWLPTWGIEVGMASQQSALLISIMGETLPFKFG